MNLADIILIPFPFSDLSGQKIRPAVIIGMDRKDVIVVFITTVKPEGDYLPILANKENNLKKDSYLRYTKIATLDRSVSLGKIGSVSKKDFLEIKTSVVNFLF